MKTHRAIENALRYSTNTSIEPDHQETDYRRHREAGKCQLPRNAPSTCKACKYFERFGYRTTKNACQSAGKHIGRPCDLCHETAGTSLHKLGAIEFKCFIKDTQADVSADIHRNPADNQSTCKHENMLQKSADNNESRYQKNRLKWIGGNKSIQPRSKIMRGVDDYLISSHRERQRID